MLSEFAMKKGTFFDLKKKTEFFRVQKITFFTHAFRPKMPIFFVYLNLIKICLEIMLSDFAEKKKLF